MESCMTEFRKVLRKMRAFIPRCRSWLDDQMEKICGSKWVKANLTFYRLHWAYFLGIAAWGALILWLSHSSKHRQMSVVDAIFNSTSILTVTGLLTVRMADFSLSEKLFLLILMTLGSHVFTSLLPLYVRRYHFHRHHKQLVRENMNDWPGENHEHGIILAQNMSPRWQSRNPNGSPSHDINVLSLDDASDGGRQQQISVSSRTNDRLSENHRAIPSEGAHNGKPYLHPVDVPASPSNHGADSSEGTKSGEHYLHRPHAHASPLMLAKSDEHESLVTLCRLVPTYSIVVQLLAFALNEIYFALSPNAKSILQIRDINSVFFSFFTSVSAFTNSGVPVHDDNLVPFRRHHFILLLYTTISLSGNLLYPMCLRLLIQVFHRFASQPRKNVYRYLLDHPRKCYTHLFPFKQTVWLVVTVLGFTVLQLIFFCALDWNSTALKGLDAFSRMIAGVYQSVSVRNSGGAAVAISGLAPTMLVLYVFMMYIAAYPIFLLRQNSTEYDEADIAIFHGTKLEAELTDNSLTFQTRKLLAKDSAYLCIILFTICVIEGDKIVTDPLNYSVFNIIFEVVSAYGGVGMSVGYNCALRLSPTSPCEDVPYSFSGKWSPAGKIILTVVMLMGRHRGLPDEIDSAIKLNRFSPHPRLGSARNSLDRPPTKETKHHPPTEIQPV